MNKFRLKLLFVLAILMSTTTLWAADGDVFTVKTVEGVDMTFKVISEEEKTCSVGNGYYSKAIPVETEGNITISTEVNGYRVIGIGSHAFESCGSLTNIVIPNGVTSIGDEAFAECKSLTALNLPSTVTTIGDEAFRLCPSLASITVDANNQTFDSRNNCNGIINTAENKLVLGCLNTVIPNSVTIIGEAAFMGSGIINCSIPNGVKTIEETAIFEIENLETLSIPNSVDSIGRECILKCPKLKTVTIGSGIKVIMTDNFYRCESLKDFYCYAESIPDIRKNNRSGGSYSYYEYPYSFDGSPLFESTPIDQAILHIPAASLETYKNTTPWSGFGSIVSLTDEETSIIYVINDQKEETFYDLNGREVKTPRKGIYIQNGRKVVR